uniref:Receptor expression-enhancing protein n=1 Tax=Strix occidentalis caurina TaxID=311401 RepID=A0A8D0EZB5_STROC
MVSWMLSRVIVLVFGMLYPAYASYKAVKSKNIREYVRWMMYWIIFALFTATETFTDLLISWFPFYYEIKTAFVIWLLSPYTRGASLLYRKFVHPTLSRKEKVKATWLLGRRRGGPYVPWGGSGVLAGRLRSFSMHDLRSVPDETPVHYRDPLYLEEQESHRQLLGELGQGGDCCEERGAPVRPVGGPCQELSCAPLSPASAGQQYESETDDEELWSDSQVSPQPSPRSSREPKPLSRSHSLRGVRKTTLGKEVPR